VQLVGFVIRIYHDARSLERHTVYLKYTEYICCEILCFFQNYEPKDPGVMKIVDSDTLNESDVSDFKVPMLNF